MTVSIEKSGFTYRIASQAVMADGQGLVIAKLKQKLAGKDAPVWTREFESELAERCVKAAHTHAAALSADEADVFRFVAQLVKTRYPDVAAALEKSHADYFSKHQALRARSFPEVVSAGLVKDVSRFRNVMEHHLQGERSW